MPSERSEKGMEFFMNKKLIYIIIGAILVIGIIAGIVFGMKNKNSKGLKLETAEEMKTMFEKIYSDLGDTLPSLETAEIDVNDASLVTTFTGLKSNKDVEALVVSEPLINAQSYSAVAVKVKNGADIETMKKEMLDNINTHKWICVSAEKVYVTNSGNIIFLVMASEDWAKPVYEGFKTYANNEIGKELERTESSSDVELPPEMIVMQ